MSLENFGKYESAIIEHDQALKLSQNLTELILKKVFLLNSWHAGVL